MDDDTARTYDEWLAKEAERDNKYLQYMQTTEGQQVRAKLLRWFPGIKTEPASNGVLNRFLRDAATPGSPTWQLLQPMMRYNTHDRPPISSYQLLLLVLLGSRTRRMTNDQVLARMGIVSQYWAAPTRSRRAELQTQLSIAAASGLFTAAQCNCQSRHYCDYILASGEECHFFTDRYSQGILAHTLTPPYDPKKRYPKKDWDELQREVTLFRNSPTLGKMPPPQDTKEPRAISNVPFEVIRPIFEHIPSTGGILVLAYKQSTVKFGWKHAQILPDTYRISVADTSLGPADYSWDFPHNPRHNTFPDELQMVFDMRLVSNACAHHMAECFFKSSMVFQRVMNLNSNYATCELFVPFQGSNNAESFDIALRYRVIERQAFRRAIHPVQARIFCSRDVLDVKKGPPEKLDLASCRMDYVCMDEIMDRNWLVRSDEARGLQVRGFLFRVKIRNFDKDFMTPDLEHKLQVFTWTLVHRPQDAPKNGWQYVLDLGDVVV